MTNLTKLAKQIVTLRTGYAQTPQARPPVLTYKAEQHTGAMVALFLPASVGRLFELPGDGALDPSEYHLTLGYLGKADNLTPEQVNGAHDLMKLIAENHPPLTGAINGCGRFCNGDEGGDPFLIIPDLAALPNLREIVIDGLRANDIKSASDHGFTPHITLAYIPHDAPNPFDQIERTHVTFPAISLVIGNDRYDYPFTIEAVPISKAALIQKIGSRHTGAECETIQKMHDLALDLGAECHPLRLKAGARHSHADQGLVQRMHDDCAGLGAACKALPVDEVYSRQVFKNWENSTASQRKGRDAVNNAIKAGNLKKASTKMCYRCRKRRGEEYHHINGYSEQKKLQVRAVCSKCHSALDPNYKAFVEGTKIIKAQSDAPNYRAASTPQRCKNCKHFRGDPGEDYCTLFDFTADQDYVCDDWVAQRPDEIPGYSAISRKGGITRSRDMSLELKDWNNSSLSQRKGRDAVNNAIKAGILKKASTKKCFKCRKRPGAEYHHIDGYTEGQKLNVRPVCNRCHAKITYGTEANKGDLAALTEGILILRGGDKLT